MAAEIGVRRAEEDVGMAVGEPLPRGALQLRPGVCGHAVLIGLPPPLLLDPVQGAQHGLEAAVILLRGLPGGEPALSPR